MDWENKAQFWVKAEEAIEKTSRSAVSELMARTNLQPGEHVLDIGCGPGMTLIHAAQLVGQEGTVTGIDIASPMVQRAQSRTNELSQVKILHGNAQNFDFGASIYDIVLSSFGVMFFDEPEAAFANLLQATAPSGRMVFVAWADKRLNPWFAGPRRALLKAIPDLPPLRSKLPGPLAFADAPKTASRLRSAGWTRVSYEEVGLHLTPPGTPEEVSKLRYFMSLEEVVRENAKSDAEAEEMAQICISEFAKELREFNTPTGLQIPARVNFFSANRPD